MRFCLEMWALGVGTCRETAVVSSDFSRLLLLSGVVCIYLLHMSGEMDVQKARKPRGIKDGEFLSKLGSIKH